MKATHRAAAAALVTALALTATAAATTPASATPAGATAKAAAYNGVCGTGYKVIDSTPVGNSGTTYVTWNESTGKNCAVTIRDTTGSPIYIAVELNALVGHETTPSRDNGQYTKYAGPVYVTGRGHCIEWYGVIGNASGGDSGHCA
ncbi:hypothetical protein OK074_5472 [Actinobacteria bacterium OK074]|nr:hypothetical protein OK074_5472 [Actinobacteria bacterium OK074]